MTAASARVKPTFLIAGGVASGTSFLSAALASHPEVYLPFPQRPEPNFFHYSWKYNRGLDWWLDTWFADVSDELAIGERSSLLLTSEFAARRIYESSPDLKLVFCLRNPVERAWGNYRFTALEGLEGLSFADALDAEDDRARGAEGDWAEVRPHAYIERSRYSTHLLEFIDLFGNDQIMMIKSEQMARHPEASIAQVCSFIGVDDSLRLVLPPSYSSPTVKNLRTQVRLREYFGDRFSELIELVRTEADPCALAETEDDRKMIEELRDNMTGGKQALSARDRSKVVRALKDEIAALGSIVPFGVDDWR